MPKNTNYTRQQQSIVYASIQSLLDQHQGLISVDLWNDLSGIINQQEFATIVKKFMIDQNIKDGDIMVAKNSYRVTISSTLI